MGVSANGVFTYPEKNKLPLKHETIIDEHCFAPCLWHQFLYRHGILIQRVLPTGFTKTTVQSLLMHNG